MASDLERALGALTPVYDTMIETGPQAGNMFVRLEGVMSIEAYSELLLATRLAMDNMQADGEIVIQPPSDPQQR